MGWSQYLACKRCTPVDPKDLAHGLQCHSRDVAEDAPQVAPAEMAQRQLLRRVRPAAGCGRGRFWAGCAALGPGCCYPQGTVFAQACMGATLAVDLTLRQACGRSCRLSGQCPEHCSC